MALARRVTRAVRRSLDRLAACRRGLGNWDAFGDLRAQQRATELLRQHLTAAQRAEFDRSRGFIVSGESGTRYRINYGTTANIDVLSRDGTIRDRLCAAPFGIPTPAIMLTQKLMLETREAEFLAIAVRHPFPRYYS